MYGTIAHFRIKPGTRDEFVKIMDSFGGDIIPGWVVDYYFLLDDPEWHDGFIVSGTGPKAK